MEKETEDIDTVWKENVIEELQKDTDATKFAIMILFILIFIVSVVLPMSINSINLNTKKIKEQENTIHQQESQINELRDRLNIVQNNLEVHVENCLTTKNDKKKKSK